MSKGGYSKYTVAHTQKPTLPLEASDLAPKAVKIFPLPITFPSPFWPVFERPGAPARIYRGYSGEFQGHLSPVDIPKLHESTTVIIDSHHDMINDASSSRRDPETITKSSSYRMRCSMWDIRIATTIGFGESEGMKKDIPIDSDMFDRGRSVPGARGKDLLTSGVGVEVKKSLNLGKRLGALSLLGSLALNRPLFWMLFELECGDGTQSLSGPIGSRVLAAPEIVQSTEGEVQIPVGLEEDTRGASECKGVLEESCRDRGRITPSHHKTDGTRELLSSSGSDGKRKHILITNGQEFVHQERLRCDR
ncbi:hypothetical protein P691DRAFT_781612 [Macrolepiota fuliginosa MF-IS2]|uniref:Uncharacterized protein n=1 Tax=Macrolepiota fuliginosa MF-IS2 TaxID=1400762 RepID=A0A9P5XBJ8_9AGAR|nr:hypothetical protein P691DRAFT_781612 [Macrolepiota fuliginosa MF-IS2]